jgi:hypothetical protein
MDNIPDIYFDGAAIMLSPFDALLTLTRRSPLTEGTPGQPVAIIRMSHEQAKVLTIMLRRTLKSHEDQLGTKIPLHPVIYSELGVSPKEDWW